MSGGFSAGAGIPLGMVSGPNIVNVQNASASAQGQAPVDECVFKDLINLCYTDCAGGGGASGSGGGSSGSGGGAMCMDHTTRYLTGLLEVEPLHFVCYATSDGTRMERLDSGQYCCTSSCI